MDESPWSDNWNPLCAGTLLSCAVLSHLTAHVATRRRQIVRKLCQLIKAKQFDCRREITDLFLALRIKNVDLDRERDAEAKSKKFMNYKEKLKAMSRKERKVAFGGGIVGVVWPLRCDGRSLVQRLRGDVESSTCESRITTRKSGAGEVMLHRECLWSVIAMNFSITASSSVVIFPFCSVTPPVGLSPSC